jgi:hypothetical protein
MTNSLWHHCTAMATWIGVVQDAIIVTDRTYPFLFYGTDWLAFAHVILAIAFIGPFRDPIRNIWIVEFGMLACILVLPTAFLFGSIRGIPFFWQLIDCSFGVLGVIPLWLAHREIIAFEQSKPTEPACDSLSSIATRTADV